MHLYTAENEDRVRILGALGVIAALLSIGIGAGVDALDAKLPPWLGPPGAMGVFSALFLAYNRFLWKLRLPRGLRLSKIPVLDGSWVGEVDLEGDEETVTLPCLVDISQTWLQLSTQFHTAHTHSVSISATVRGAGTVYGDFRYEYHVEPRAGHILDGMSSHDGVARLRFTSADWSTMEGDFFNDAAYTRHGRYTLRRQADRLSVDQWLNDQ